MLHQDGSRAAWLAGQPPLKHWTQVHCHLGAEDVPARVAALQAWNRPVWWPMALVLLGLLGVTVWALRRRR